METGHTKYLYSTHPRIVDNFNINQANITPLNNYYGTYIHSFTHTCTRTDISIGMWAVRVSTVMCMICIHSTGM